MFKQVSFDFTKKYKNSHGGRDALGKRKCARPISTKDSIHIVLKSSQANGQRNMLRKVYSNKLEATVRYYSKVNFVKIDNYTNVGNHLHLLVRAKTRSGFKRFLKTITARIAIIVTGAKKGQKFGRFWDHLAFTRIVKWCRDYIGFQLYMTKNIFEGEGIYLETPTGEYKRFLIRDGTLVVS